MKYIRFIAPDKNKYYGIIDGDKALALKKPPFNEIESAGKSFLLNEIEFLSPVEFSKAICIGLNYKDHAEEFGLPIPSSPVVFLKPSTSALGHKGKIIYPNMSKRLDYEAELAVVIKTRCHRVSETEALDYVLGYTIANDVTARDLQPKDGQWTIAKSFDTFMPLGPYISDEVSPDDLYITSRVNGETKQESRTSNLIFKVPFLISYLSSVMTLLPGDIISTGTPGGISGMTIGSKVEIEIEGLGILENTIAEEIR